MAGYVVTLVFDVDEAQAVTGRQLMAGWWGSGREFSLLDGPLLTLVAEIEAPCRGDAFDAVLGHAGIVWSARGGGTLPPPRTARVEPVTSPSPAPSPHGCGAVGRGPDRVLAEAVAGRAACLRAAVAALVELDRAAGQP